VNFGLNGQFFREGYILLGIKGVLVAVINIWVGDINIWAGVVEGGFELVGTELEVFWLPLVAEAAYFLFEDVGLVVVGRERLVHCILFVYIMGGRKTLIKY